MMPETSTTEKPKSKQQLNRDFLQNLGMELKIARIRCKLTQKQVSELTGLTEACIRDVENGVRDAKILTYKRMAEALGVGLKEVLQS